MIQTLLVFHHWHHPQQRVVFDFDSFGVSVIFFEVPSRRNFVCGGGHVVDVVDVVSPSTSLDNIACTSPQGIVHAGAVVTITVPAWPGVVALAGLSSGVDSNVRADLVLASFVFALRCARDPTAK